MKSIGLKPDIVEVGAGSRVVCLMVRCLAGFRWWSFRASVCELPKYEITLSFPPPLIARWGIK